MQDFTLPADLQQKLDHLKENLPGLTVSYEEDDGFYPSGYLRFNMNAHLKSRNGYVLHDVCGYGENPEEAMRNSLHRIEKYCVLEGLTLRVDDASEHFKVQGDAQSGFVFSSHQPTPAAAAVPVPSI